MSRGTAQFTTHTSSSCTAKQSRRLSGRQELAGLLPWRKSRSEYVKLTRNRFNPDYHSSRRRTIHRSRTDSESPLPDPEPGAFKPRGRHFILHLPSKYMSIHIAIDVGILAGFVLCALAARRVWRRWTYSLGDIDGPASQSPSFILGETLDHLLLASILI